MATQPPQPESAVWRPVEPALTHCLGVESLSFDMPHDDFSDGWAENALDALRSDNPLIWPSALFTIRAGHPGEMFRTRIRFHNVVSFEFRQSNFGELYVDEGAGTTSEVYDNTPLISVPGFRVKGGLRPIGAFCLWECRNSPQTLKLASTWRAWKTSLEEKSHTLRHFKLLCDDVGEFQLVGVSVEIARMFS